MVADEHARHALHTRLAQTLGHEEADTLMAYLPPVGWADVATKRDLNELEARMTSRLDGVIYREIARLDESFHQRFDTLRAEQHAQTRTLFFSVIGSNLTIAALAFAAAQVV